MGEIEILTVNGKKYKCTGTIPMEHEVRWYKLHNREPDTHVKDFIIKSIEEGTEEGKVYNFFRFIVGSWKLA